ncbi:MAG: DUF2889 domain-containing protein [Alphaproteobacteria bacterium]|nr:DUF2889 domain-containing protein [Alphaproteobacteria bacterium]
MESDKIAKKTAGTAPVRRAQSVRRTSTIDTHWPEEYQEDYHKPMQLVGRARDIFTDKPQNTPRLLAEDKVTILASSQREILAITSQPPRPQIEKLIGCRAGKQLRAAISDALPDEAAQGTPLHLLLDDMAGASLVAFWAWSQWPDEKARLMAEQKDKTQKDKTENNYLRRRVVGVCTGFAPGAPSLNEDGSAKIGMSSSAPATSLINPQDPHGWHEIKEQTTLAARRARWIDIWRADEKDELAIETGFQDSATRPDGGRQAVHEYRILAQVRADNFELTQLHIDPRILPYSSCLAAPRQANIMLGKPLSDFRSQVLTHLRGVKGCTHLNDMLRDLAEVPLLARQAGLV